MGAKCHLVNGLYIQTSLAVNCLPATSDCYMRKNDGLENYLKKKKKNFFFFFFFLVFSHPGGSVSLPGVRESGCIYGRLPDDPGGFTCMELSPELYNMSYRKLHDLLSYAHWA